ncbi:MAG: GH39 family glycosyl hydrolase, partial [Acidimicrobiales bacterium]
MKGWILAGIVAPVALAAAIGVPQRTPAAASPGQRAKAAAAAAGRVRVTVDAGRQPAGAARIDEGLVGVNGPGPASATAAMAGLGLRWVRTDVGFESSYDCATGRWDPTALDARVEQIRAEGASPLLIVDYTPPCLAPLPVVPAPGNITYEPPDVGTQADGTNDKVIWDGLVEQMAAHEVALGVRAFEVWNEPDGTFWYGGLPGYLNLYADTAPALETGAAEAGCSTTAGCRIEVGGPALVFPDATWIEPFLSFVSAQHLPLDFVSWHYYADYPLLGPYGPVPSPPPGVMPVWYNPALRAQVYGLQVTQVRAEVAKFPSLHPVLWIDEWNVDAGYDPRQSGPYGAAFVAAVLDSAQSARLDRMTFF